MGRFGRRLFQPLTGLSPGSCRPVERGFCGSRIFPSSVCGDQREKILLWIAEYSPYGLAGADAPPVYMWFGSAPAVGQEQTYPTHTANFWVKLQERLGELKVESELVYPGASGVKHASIQDFLIERVGTQ